MIQVSAVPPASTPACNFPIIDIDKEVDLDGEVAVQGADCFGWWRWPIGCCSNPTRVGRYCHSSSGMLECLVCRSLKDVLDESVQC